jgi:hypothetical protein
MTYTYRHKVLIYKEYQSVRTLVRIGSLPSPLSPASVPLPPNQRGEGWLTRLAARGWESPYFDDWRKA